MDIFLNIETKGEEGGGGIGGPVSPPPSLGYAPEPESFLSSNVPYSALSAESCQSCEPSFWIAPKKTDQTQN